MIKITLYLLTNNFKMTQMLWKTHRRIAQRIAGGLKLSSREASQLEKGSVEPDRWKDYPHHHGKERQIRKNIIETRRLFLNDEKLESLFRFGVALHYIQDRWVTTPGSSEYHSWWEEQIDEQPFVDIDIMMKIINETDFIELFSGLSVPSAQENRERYFQIHEKILEFDRLCQRYFENHDGRFVEDVTLQIATLDRPKLGTPTFDLNFAYRVSLMVALSVYGPQTSSAILEKLMEMRKGFEIRLIEAEEALARKLVELNSRQIELKQKGGFINWLKRLICDFRIWSNRRRYEKRKHLIKIQETYYGEAERESNMFRNWYNVTIPKLDIEQVKRLLL